MLSAKKSINQHVQNMLFLTQKVVTQKIQKIPVTRAYVESEQESEDSNDDIVNLLDQDVLGKNVEELLWKNKQNKSKKQEKSKHIDGICQEFILREDWESFCKCKTSKYLRKSLSGKDF